MWSEPTGESGDHDRNERTGTTPVGHPVYQSRTSVLDVLDPGPGANGVGPWRSSNPPADFAPFPSDAIERSLADRFLSIADRFADREALSSPAGSWTYAELRRDAGRFAGGVQALVDRAPGEPVAILATHDGPLVVAILGVVLAGHVVVVLDPVAPVAHLSAVLDAAGAPLLVHDEALAGLAAELAKDAPSVRTAAFGDVDGDESPVGRGPDDALMLAFTSGTSGTPKAAVITNGVIVNLVAGASNALGVTEHDRMPMLFPTSMAVAAYPMFIPLLNGGTLATLDVRGVGLEPVAAFLADERITLAYMAPTVVRFLVDALADTELPHMRMLALGGEVVDPEVVQLVIDLFDPVHIANGFGTTETGVIALYVIDPSDPPSGAVPAGYPVDGVELMVLDDAGAIVAPGESGEVAVASPHLFEGYWGHPELTAQVLLDDPQGRPGWGLYRTGDLGRLDESGALVVMGRLDSKVKIRGRLVVVGDVEASIHALPDVADVAVVTSTDDGIVSLHAFVVSADAPVEPEALRRALLVDHESFRVPSRWHVVDELPHLPNGKIDRRALATAAATPAADTRPSARPAEPVRPVIATRSELTATETRLAEIWSSLLPVATIGPDADFTALGGDSLLAAQMLIVVEHRFGVIVPMSDLVNARTLRSLAAAIERRRDGGGSEVVSCVQEGDESTRPRLWFVPDLQGSGYRVRHVAAALGVDQPVWSFESPLLRGEPSAFADLEEFSAFYVEQLLAAQPDGPYWLAGYSFGGICAFEMARQLELAGHEVAFLGVVDVGPGYRGPAWAGLRPPFRPWFGVAKPPEPDASVKEQWRHYRSMWSDGPSRVARHLSVRSGLAERIDPARFRRDLRIHGRVRPDWRLWYAWDEHWRLAVKAWDRGSTFPGVVDLFWADDTPSTDDSLGWRPLVGELVLRRFPGDHYGILEPRGAPQLANVLRTALDGRIADRADAGGPSGGR